MPADGSIATADIPTGSSMLTITGVAAGMATVTVTATDALHGDVQRRYGSHRFR
jgi:hypothetical protein